MQFPVFIHKDPDSDYGVIIPDLPGCFSAGHNIEDAIHNAHEAIACHLEGLLMDNEPIPLIKSIEQHLNNRDFEGGVLAIVAIDMSTITGEIKRINISLPKRFLRQIDDYVRRNGVNRSGFLLDAAMHLMAERQG